MREVKATGQRGHGAMVIRSGQNVVDADKRTLSISRKPSAIELWLLLNANRKSSAAYHLPRSSVSPNHAYAR